MFHVMLSHLVSLPAGRQSVSPLVSPPDWSRVLPLLPLLLLLLLLTHAVCQLLALGGLKVCKNQTSFYLSKENISI